MMFEKHWSKQPKNKHRNEESPSQGAPTLPSLLNFSFLPSGRSFTHHKITLTWKKTHSITPSFFSQINSNPHLSSLLVHHQLRPPADVFRLTDGVTPPWVWHVFFFQFIQNVKCKFPCFPQPLFSLQLVYRFFSGSEVLQQAAGMNSESHRDLWRELCVCACAEGADQQIHAPQINEPVPVQCVWQKGRIIPRRPLRWD